jgi:Spy/CpxP family protein refolding chaperone
MSVALIRRSILGVAATAAILAGGAAAGRLAAGPMSRDRHLSVGRMFDRVARRLDLSDTQRAEIKDVLRSHKSEILAQIEAHHAARKALRAAIKAEPLVEAAVRDRAQSLGRVEGDGALLRARIRLEVLPILNDDQKQKLEAFQQRFDSTGEKLAASVSQFLGSQP